MQDPLFLMRKAGWLLFWILAAVALLDVLLFAYVAVTALGAFEGGHGRIWFFGNAWLAVSASVLYLVLVAVVFAKRRSRGASHRPGA